MEMSLLSSEDLMATGGLKMYNLNHKKFLNGKLAGEANLKFQNLHSAQSRMHWDLVILQEELCASPEEGKLWKHLPTRLSLEELCASPEEGKLSAYIQADNDYNQSESHEFMITEM